MSDWRRDIDRIANAARKANSESQLSTGFLHKLQEFITSFTGQLTGEEKKASSDADARATEVKAIVVNLKAQADLATPGSQAMVRRLLDLLG